MYRIFSVMALFAAMGQAQAHAPYVAPYQFFVEGGNTPIVAGFAEGAFDSEVAIRGFEFSSVNPKGESKELPLTNIHSISMANLPVAEEGTYQILGQRDEKIKYANLDGRWLRVLDPKGTALASLKERQFIAESELKTETPQISVTRFDELTTYLTKKKTSDLTPLKSHVKVNYSTHPNQLRKGQTVGLNVTLHNQPASKFEMKVEKKLTTVNEKEWSTEAKTDSKGKAQKQD